MPGRPRRREFPRQPAPNSIHLREGDDETRPDAWQSRPNGRVWGVWEWHQEAVMDLSVVVVCVWGRGRKASSHSLRAGWVAVHRTWWDAQGLYIPHGDAANVCRAVKNKGTKNQGHE